VRARSPWPLLVLTGCVSVAAAPDSGVSPPFNTCPAHPCTAYNNQTPAPICNGGACLASSLYSDLVLVVSLSEDSDFAPGHSIAISYNDLVFSPAGITCAQNTQCAQLPGYAIVQGAYQVSLQVQSPPPVGLGWNLGNPDQQYSALPVHVTYRPLWPPSGSGVVDATSLALPLALIPAFVVVETAPSSPPGPGQGPSIGFQANLQPTLYYEATIQPDPPFDAIFPPDVEDVTFMTGLKSDEDSLTLDTTMALGSPPVPGAQIPNFSVSRSSGNLVGWQAYLRDVTTLRRLSTLVTLGSSPKVVLPTNHHPASGDALTGTELVLAPPANGSPLPTYVAGLTAGELPYTETVPQLPTPLTVTGNVTDVSGTTPVEAQLFFEVAGAISGTGIYVDEPSTGTTLNTTNFEYAAQTTATYSITLPPGEYRVTARPLDTVHQVTVVTAFNVDPTAGATSPQVLVDVLRPVQGYALIADGRPMAGALVEAVPSSCANSPPPPAQPPSAYCMPRDAQTTTDANGTYELALDPGNYVLRVEPQSGTGFPWVTLALLVPATPVTVPAVTVPAPVNAGIQLWDPYGNPVVDAVVRLFQVPTTGPAVEVGLALTDSTGTYDLYLAPSSP
jgi:hypothetical protein